MKNKIIIKDAHDEQESVFDDMSILQARLEQYDGKLPFTVIFPLAIQHVLVMYFNNLLPVLMVAGVAIYSRLPFAFGDKVMMVQVALLMAGLATLLQALPCKCFGARMPIVTGTSFAFMFAAMTIAHRGYDTFVGACIVSAALMIVLGLTAKYWYKLISPLVCASVVLTIGLCLTCEAVEDLSSNFDQAAASWWQWGVGLATMATCLAVNRYVKSVWKEFHILAGITVGCVLAAIISLTGMEQLFNISQLRFTVDHMGAVCAPELFKFVPKFDLGAILAVCAISVVSIFGIIGNTSMIAYKGFGRELTDKELRGAICGNGLINLLGATLLGGMPVAPYAQNSSMVCTTKMVNRAIFIAVAILLIACAFCPALSASLYLIPGCVVSGCLIVMFGAIVGIGVEMLYRCGKSKRTIIIALVSLICGITASYLHEVMPDLPETFRCVFDHNPIVGVFFVSLILSLVWRQKNADAK